MDGKQKGPVQGPARNSLSRHSGLGGPVRPAKRAEDPFAGLIFGDFRAALASRRLAAPAGASLHLALRAALLEPVLARAVPLVIGAFQAPQLRRKRGWNGDDEKKVEPKPAPLQHPISRHAFLRAALALAVSPFPPLRAGGGRR